MDFILKPKNILKIVALMICVFLCAPLISACGEKENPPPVSDITDITDITTVTTVKNEAEIIIDDTTPAPAEAPKPTEPPPPPLVINPPGENVDIFDAAGISKDHLLAYWRFKEMNAENKIVDETGNGRDLYVAPNTAKIVTENAFRSSSLQLASNQRAEFIGRADEGTKFPEMTALTVNVWARIDNVDDIGDCAPIFENDSTFRIIIASWGGHAVLADENDAWYAGGTANCWTDGSFEDMFGEWQMLTMTYDGETITTYLNGELDGENEQAGGGGKIKPAARFFIGDPNASWGTGFNGAVDELSVLSTCLSEKEVKALFMAYAGPQG